MIKATPDSPAFALLAHVWRHEGHKMPRSWARLNSAMQDALNLAIYGLMEFHVGDFARINKEFRGGYWMGTPPEGWYSKACGSSHQGRSHGPNTTAQRSFEEWVGRKPFYVAKQPLDKTKVKLHVGESFTWFDDHIVTRENEMTLYVTSFSDQEKSVVACSYVTTAEKPWDRSKIKRRFALTHDDIRAHHAAIKAKLKEIDAKKQEASQC